MTVRFYTFDQMKKLNERFPHPEGSIEAGWYFHIEGVPVGPYENEDKAKLARVDELKIIQSLKM